ncbi:HAAS signaling domain-containing protein [Streptodolium elevatio]|uniref:Uncharacterized protein n=1 Tax=Streptodolium elevatio TaxID=3157996 RepID=A0ABV3DQA9_9ACTN
MSANGTTTLLHELGADYRDAVYAALADLPGEELADALEEVETNLVEVVGELTAAGGEISMAALRARLGTPREYADEFRVAAGYPPAVGSPGAMQVAPNQLAVAALFVSAAFALASGVTVMADADSWVWGPLTAAAVLFAALPGQWLRAQAPSLDAVPLWRFSLVRTPSAGRAAGETASPGGALPRPSRELRADLAEIARLWGIFVAVGLGVGAHKAGAAPAAGVVIALIALLPCIRLGRVLRRTVGRDRRLLWLAVPLTTFTVGLGIGLVFDEARGRTDYYAGAVVHDGRVSVVQPGSSGPVWPAGASATAVHNHLT